VKHDLPPFTPVPLHQHVVRLSRPSGILYVPGGGKTAPAYHPEAIHVDPRGVQRRHAVRRAPDRKYNPRRCPGNARMSPLERDDEVEREGDVGYGDPTCFGHGRGDEKGGRKMGRKS
jgi:hypothetical protein